MLAIFGITSFSAMAQSQTNNHIIAAREYMKSGNNNLARLELDSAALLSPGNPQVNELQGDIYTEEKRYARAITSYDMALIANKTDPDLLMKRAALHRKLDNHRIYVLNDYNAAIQLDPENIEYYKTKANYLANSINPETYKLDFEGASLTINDAIQVDNTNANLYYLKAQYLAGGEQYLSALVDINKAITLQNTNPLYYALRGKIFFGITKYQEAFSDYSRAISLDSTKYQYYESRAHAFYNLGYYIRAYDDYSKAIDMIIKHIAHEQGTIESSDPLNKSLRLNLLYRGMALVQDNRPYDGCDDFKRAYQMGEIKARNYMRKYCY